MKKAVFLDRDGVIIEEREYAHKIEDCVLLPNSTKGLKLLKDFKLIIVTNQSGIGKKIFSEKNYHEFNKHLLKELKKEKISIARSYFCPHDADKGCLCRKPKTKFLKDAKKEFNIDLKNSYMIGDKKSDVDFGKNGGLTTIHVLTGYGKKFKDTVNPDFVAHDLLDAARWILRRENENKKI